MASPFTDTHEVLACTSYSAHAHGRAVAAFNSSIIPLNFFQNFFLNQYKTYILRKPISTESLGKRSLKGNRGGWVNQPKPHVFVFPSCCR